ncbi:MAG TPA: alpha-2-macroglobulin family protein [Planctomycetota bacterium]|nr:alpha-2-macroglobulin family protein [Planctomycetota bacterium]
MTCERIRARLSWLLDGELEAEEEAAVRAHAQSCPSCGPLLAELQACDEDIRGALAGAQPRPEFARRVAQAAVRKPLSWSRLALGAAAGFLILLGSTSLYVNTREAPPLTVAVHGGQRFHADSMGALRVFVTNAVTSLPIAQASVRVAIAGNPVGTFLTNPAGSIDGFFHVPDLADGSYPLRIEVQSPVGADVLEQAVTVEREYRLLVTTDKPLYQPGQTLHLRMLALNAFTLKPRSGDGQVEVVDSRGNVVFSKKVELSEFGIASADFTLADEVNLGTYRIAVSASGLRQERTVDVARYALPKFKLDLEQARESYRPGDRIRATVRAKYFFGKPVQGRVQARLGREVVTGDLSPDGRWDFEVPAPEPGTYSAEITVTDTADHKESKAVPVIVSREALKVVLYPEGGAVLRSAPNTYFLLVSAPNGRPLKADLRLVVNGVQQDVETDELGVAKVLVQGTDIRLEWARDKAGSETRSLQRLGEVGGRDFLIRLDKPAYRGGETMKLKVVGSPGGPVYVDVIKGGQLILSTVAEKDEVAVDLPPDLFGTVQVAAYTRQTTAPVVRLAYVNLPEGLKIRPRVLKETFRPGEEMGVEFEVVDQKDRPVRAALGLSVVDEALFGLVESKIASEKAWLSLAPELIDTRGFLQADAAAIYQGGASNAQRFVGGNGHADPLPMLVRNPSFERQQAVALFVMEWNEALWTLFVSSLVLAGLGLAAWTLFLLLRRLARARLSGVTVLMLIAVTIFFMLMLFGRKEWKRSYAPEAEFSYAKPAPAESGPAPVAETRPRTVLRPRETGAFRGESAYDEVKPVMSSRSQASVIPRDPDAEAKGSVTPAPEPAPARVRELFPETLFWQPQLITDDRGRARVTLPAADSITSWRMLASAVSRDGALGADQASLRVFQDFFVDIDFPVALTKGDRVHVPVAVYNYLKAPQTVTVRVQPDSWFELLDEGTRSIRLQPGEVTAVYFGLHVKEHGRKTLTVLADGQVQDAIRRSVEVMEKGREVPISVSDRVQGRRTLRVVIPPRAIDGASVLFVRLTPGMSDLVTGLEGMIRMPSGCFEQTLSSAYPNVALHAYLKESGQLTKETEERLRQAHSIAVQKILSFENPSGGFGWYPGREANLVLSAYGTMFLADLATVYEYDHHVLDRTIRWLEARQDASGSWSGHDHGSTWSRLSNAAIPSTAYVAWALQRAGRVGGPALTRAEEFLRRFDDDDAYAAALIANAFPTKRNLDQLAKLGKDGRWTTKVQSWTRARDGAADLETTALAVLALAEQAPGLADQGAAWIIQARDPYGAWGSTQPTVLALRALARAGGGASRDRIAAKLWVNGKEIPGAFAESESAQSFDISPSLVSGTNEIELETSRRVNAQVAGRYYLPWGTDDVVRGVDGLTFRVAYDRAEVKVGETLTCTVSVEADAFAMMAEVAIPPGFTVDSSGFDDLVKRHVIDRVGQNGRTLVFYLPGKGATFRYALKPRYPMKVVVPRSVAYEYYTPDRRVVVPPQDLEVKTP